jgi:hypothetical protein
MFLQIAFLHKRFSTAWFSTSKRLLTGVRSKMSDQVCWRRKHFSAPWLRARVRFCCLFSFLLFLRSDIRNVQAVADFIFAIVIMISMITLAFLCWHHFVSSKPITKYHLIVCVDHEMENIYTSQQSTNKKVSRDPASPLYY